ncbi:MAG: hypothetical protein IT207_00065 [Fimbriimonadaceae bacterium]|nr:hypothetical protein [Fimbriimonadaceae bacterium]
MKKTQSQVAKTTASLKLRALPKKNALSVRVGTHKYTLPFEAKILSGDKYVFVHIPPSAMLMKLDGKSLAPVTSEEEAKEASTSFRKTRSKPARKSTKKAPELPAELQNLLGKIPAGYRLDVSRDGTPRIVRTRNRKPSAKTTKSAAAKPAAAKAAPAEAAPKKSAPVKAKAKTTKAKSTKTKRARKSK